MMGARGSDIVEQDWGAYTQEQHAIWRTLFHRQEAVLEDRACAEFLAGIRDLGVEASGIPDFRRLNQRLQAATGWTIVAVPGLVPDAVFFAHLAHRRFPSTCFIRGKDQLDYLQEPDIFHDIFGHVPMLMNPVFADYMEAYGKGGLKALGLGSLHRLARLYWYTVEFGLIRTQDGPRIFGSGIVSSRGESVYCLESPIPNRLGFDLLRVMRTRYRIDNYQPSYFVIDGFAELFAATQPDFTPYYAALAGCADIAPESVLPEDKVLQRGTISSEGKDGRQRQA
jgi:phenylalanine-4-hydroxylase